MSQYMPKMKGKTSQKFRELKGILLGVGYYEFVVGWELRVEGLEFRPSWPVSDHWLRVKTERTLLFKLNFLK